MTTEPVWGTPPRRHAGTLPARADVLVVGGGMTGVALMRWLRGRGGVVLVERDRIGAGATGRNAGVVAEGAAGGTHALVARQLGRRRAAALRAFSVEAHELLIEALAGRAEHRRRGTLTEPADAEEARELEESAELLREDGFAAEWDGHGLMLPGDGELDPLQAVLALAADLPAGAVREGVDVIAIGPGSDGVRVRTATGECLAGAVVLATNGWTSQLVPAVPISPVRAQMAASAPQPGPLVEMPTSADHGYRYWRQLPDGRVIAGGFRDRALAEEVGTEAVTTELIQGHLERHLRGLGVQGPVRNRWAGIMGFTADALPIVGAVPGWAGVHVCGGYTGCGWSFALLCARRLAESLTGGRSGVLLP